MKVKLILERLQTANIHGKIMQHKFLGITNKESNSFYLVPLFLQWAPLGAGCFPGLPSALLAHVPLVGPHHHMSFISLCHTITETHLLEAEFSH